MPLTFIVFFDIMVEHKKEKRKIRGVAQLVARVLWEHDAAGSSPVTPTNKSSGCMFTAFVFLGIVQSNTRASRALGEQA